MNQPDYGWHNPGAPTSDAVDGNSGTASAQGLGAGYGPGPMPGAGHGFHGTWPYPYPYHPHGPGWAGAPPWPWYGPPGFAPGHHPAYGYHGYPPFAGTANPAQGAGPGPEAPESGATLGHLADQVGLGMFKDFFNFDDGDFWKGAVVGAALVLLLTNENLRDALAGGAAKTAAAVKSGLAAAGAENPAASDDDTENGDTENMGSGQEDSAR